MHMYMYMSLCDITWTSLNSTEHKNTMCSYAVRWLEWKLKVLPREEVFSGEAAVQILLFVVIGLCMRTSTCTTHVSVVCDPITGSMSMGPDILSGPEWSLTVTKSIVK